MSVSASSMNLQKRRSSAPSPPMNGEREVALQFQRKWNLPRALGVLDGKHVAIKCPIKPGSFYYNYKGFYSIVLMSLVDANYTFLWCDVGGAGHMSDAQIFNGSELKEAMDNRTIGSPQKIHCLLMMRTPPTSSLRTTHSHSVPTCGNLTTPEA